MRKAFYFVIILLIAVSIRLYPTLISGMPFSTDAWPLIRNTQLLIQNTPLPLNSNIFDGYNNFWPLSSIFSAILSQITTLPPMTAMALGIPIVAALTIPIFYLLAKKITRNTEISLIATILLATAFPYALFTAGVTKETFASPIYISLILIFLLKHNWKTTLLFSVASVALVLSHHLTAFLALGIITATAIASHISKNKNGKINSTQSNLFLIGILTGITSFYFVLFAAPTFTANITSSDILAASAYQFAALAATVYIVSKTKKKSLRRIISECIAVLLVILAIAVVMTKTSLLPTAPVIPIYYLLFGLPFIIALPVISTGLNKLHQKRFGLLIPLFWLIPVLAFACYGIFANPAGGLTFAVRSIDFLLPPLAILTAIGVYKLFHSSTPVKTHRLTQIVACIVIVSIVILNVNSVYATVSLQEPYLGYFWRYEPSEFQAADWLSSNVNNQTIAGDSKASYLIDGYFDKNVSITQGLLYLGGSGSPPPILYIYNQMKTNGYVLYQGIPITLSANWTDKLSNYNCIYANNEVTIYARR